MYFDELALLETCRGIDPLRFLLRPALEFGKERGVGRTMFWSTPGSNIVPLALYMGYEQVCSLEARGKEVIFLMHPAYKDFLAMLQRFSAQRLAWVMARNARLVTNGRGLTGSGLTSS